MLTIENCSGVYIIVNFVNGNCYVGSSINVLKRTWDHLFGLKGSPLVGAVC